MTQAAPADAAIAPAGESGPLTERQKELVRESFARLVPASDLVMDVFYRRLFEIAPEVRPLFPRDMWDQKRKLLAALKLAVASLNSLDAMLPALKLMGAKHRDYGVKTEHYGIVGEALLWTLEQCLQEHFTPETNDAWTAVYTVIAEVMDGSE